MTAEPLVLTHLRCFLPLPSSSASACLRRFLFYFLRPMNKIKIPLCRQPFLERSTQARPDSRQTFLPASPVLDFNWADVIVPHRRAPRGPEREGGC